MVDATGHEAAWRTYRPISPCRQAACCHFARASHITASMTRRPTRPRAYAPDPAAPGRTCDMPGCGAQGEYRAPKSRQNLHEYWWFCLEHVRAYNGSWDYYKGMSPGADRSAAARRHRLAAPVLAARPPRQLPRLGRRPAARPAARAVRRPDATAAPIARAPTIRPANCASRSPRWA